VDICRIEVFLLYQVVEKDQFGVYPLLLGSQPRFTGGRRGETFQFELEWRDSPDLVMLP
jgi:hypothetical protein